MLLAFNLPANINPLITAFGGVIAIVVAKQMFGGLGQNFVNPAPYCAYRFNGILPCAYDNLGNTVFLYRQCGC